MVGSVSPLGEVQSGQDTGLAGNPGVDLVVGQHHGVDLNVVQRVGIITENTGQLDLPDFGQLLQGEAGRPATVLVPEPIAQPEVVELFADDAGEGGTDHGAGERLLGHAGAPQVDVVRTGVVLLVSGHGLVAHDAQQLVEPIDLGESAPFSPGIVSGNTVLTTTLDVESSQIQTPGLARLLEQVVGDLLRHGVVQSLSHLVDQAHDVVVGPSALVQVVRLLQHLAESLRSDVTVGLGPSLDGGGQEGVSETEGGSGEAGSDGGVGVRVVAVEVTVLLQDQVVTLHDFLSEDHGQELVVGDVLDHGGDDVAGLLEQSLVVPVGVDLSQLLGNQVVLTDEKSVSDGQNGLFVDARITGQETVNVFAWTDATLVGFLQLEWQQRLHVELLKDGQHLELAGLEGSQRVLDLVVVGVDGAGIQEGGDLVEAVSGSQTAVVTQTGLGTDEVHATLAVLGEEVVVGWDLDGEAVGVSPAAVAALGGLAGGRVLGLGTQGDVVVDELSPGDEEDGDGVVVEPVVGMDVGGDETGGGKGLAVDGGSSWGRDAVGVVGVEEAVMAVHGGSPVRVLDVVARSGDGTVPGHLAFRRHEEGRAVGLDGGLGGVDERQAVGDGVLGQTVLLGQVAGGFVDDDAQGTDVVGLELSGNGSETDSVPGAEEGGVDGFVGDAGLTGGVSWASGSAENAGSVVKGGRSALTGDDECTAVGGGCLPRVSRWGRGSEGQGQAGQGENPKGQHDV